MDFGQIITTIINIFIIAPWWCKLIILIIFIGIPSSIYQSIMEKKDELKDEINKKKEISTIDKLINSDSEQGYRNLIDSYNNNRIKDDKYEENLLRIIKKSNSADAMYTLSNFYKDKNPNNPDINLWLKNSAHAGNICAILDYYGFSDYDVNSNSYDEILSSLENVRDIPKEGVHYVDYLKGIVEYKSGNIPKAKELIEISLKKEWTVEKTYLLFLCTLKEQDIQTAENILIELENQNYIIPAQDYLHIYNYFVSIKNKTLVEFEKQVEYALKYSTCKDQKVEIAQKILGDSYYNLGLFYQSDKKDLNFIPYKGLFAYQNAAKFDNLDAIFKLANYYWSGSGGRNYYKTIQYFGKSALSGNERAKSIIEKYGYDGILIKSEKTLDVTYEFLYGHSLTVSGKVLNWFQMYYGMLYHSYTVSEEFKARYIETFNTFEKMVNGIHTLYTDAIISMLSWSIGLLVSLNIDMFSEEDILELCNDLSLLPRVPNFEYGLDQIDNRAEQLNAKTSYAKATRTTWTGVGFGNSIGEVINSSLQASIASGVMNIGSGVLHGIGDNLVESMNNKELKNMSEKLFNNPETIKEFVSAVNSACSEITLAVMKLFDMHCDDVKMKSELQGKIVYENENLSKLEDKVLTAKINNNLSVNKNKYAYALLLEALRRDSLKTDIFSKIFELTVISGEENVETALNTCLRFAGDFNINLTDLQKTWAEKILSSQQLDSY